MSYNTDLEDRIDHYLRWKKVPYLAKKMMGWLCYMVDEKMCIGIIGDKLMCRIDPDIYEECLTHEWCHEMDFTGKVLRWYVIIEPWVIERDEELAFWIDLCIEYNPRAKSSRKRKK
jgi:TfoX/Sxy family transcriptional regulator of competence genes